MKLWHGADERGACIEMVEIVRGLAVRKGSGELGSKEVVSERWGDVYERGRAEVLRTIVETTGTSDRDGIEVGDGCWSSRSTLLMVVRLMRGDETRSERRGGRSSMESILLLDVGL